MPPPAVQNRSARSSALLLSLSLLVPSPLLAGPQDYLMMQKGLEALGKMIDDNSRAEAARREREERAEVQRRAAEAAREQQRQQTAAENRRQELAAMLPPPEFDGRLVLHKRLLQAGEQAPPDLQVDAHQSSNAAVSDDGRFLAYFGLDNQLKLVTLTDRKERSFSTDFPASDTFRWIYFVGAQGLLVIGGNRARLFDLAGNRLKAWDDVHAWASQGRVYLTHTRDDGNGPTCSGVSVFDGAGRELGAVFPDDGPAERCALRVASDDGVEALTFRDGILSYYRNGVRQARFEADTRRWSDGKLGAIHSFVGDTPYVQSSSPGSSVHRVWSLAEGRLHCEISVAGEYGYIASEPKTAQAYRMSPPSLLALPGCALTSVATDGQLALEEKHAFVSNKGTGEVAILDRSTFQILRRQRVDFSPHQPKDIYSFYARSHPGASDQLQVVVGSSGHKVPSLVLDLNSGAVLYRFYGDLSPGGDYVVKKELAAGAPQKFLIWKTTSLYNPQIAVFLSNAQKDKYETSEEYRKRMAAQALPYTLKVAVQDYDADSGRFAGSVGGVSISIPVPPAQARQLDGAKQLTINGSLQRLNGDFLELRNASLAMPDGKAFKLAPQPQQPVSTAQASPLPASAEKLSLKARGKAMAASSAGRCAPSLDYLAPQMRPYSDPNLAALRSEILGSSVSGMLAEVKAQGGSVQSAIGTSNRQAEEFEKMAREAADSANQTDGGPGNSIRSVDNGTLPLNWSCNGTHAAAVCAYIINKWGALMLRESARQFACSAGLSS